MVRRRDLWWILGGPIYAVLCSLRHEASHALVGLIEGARVIEFRFLPILDGRFRPWSWGHVRFWGDHTWLTTAAPYLCDLVTYGLAFLLLMSISFRRRWLWLNILIVGLASPLVDSLANYVTGLLGRGVDVMGLLSGLPDWVVHSYFSGTTLAYAAGLLAVLRRRAKQERLAAPARSAWDYELVAVVSCCCLAFVLGSALFFSARRRCIDHRRVFHHAWYTGDAEVVGEFLDLCVDPDARHRKHSLLTAAITGRHHEVVEVLLEAGADPDMPSPGGWTPMALATFNGDVETVRLLLAFGARADGRALRDALQFGQPRILRLLLENGVRFPKPDSLHAAAAMGDIDRVRELLEEWADPNAETVDGLKALSAAVGAGHVEIASVLIESGADLAQGYPYVRPIHAAVWAGDAAMVALLLDAGARPDDTFEGLEGITPLHLAADRGHANLVELLIDRGADVNKAGPLGTPLFREPCHWGDFPGVAEALLDAGADPEFRNAEGFTPLGHAIRWGRTAEVRALIEAPVDLNTECSPKMMPLALASRWGRYEIVESLLAGGADPLARGERRATPVHWAAKYGHARTVEVLLAGGADANSPDDDGATPLHYALESQDSRTVEALLSADADIEAKDTERRTPLWWAGLADHAGIARLLLANGADPNVKDRFGRTLFDIAAFAGHEDVAQVLRQHGETE